MSTNSDEHYPGLGSYAVALLRDWRARHSLRRSLEELGSNERDRILRESGLDEADLNVCLSTVFGSEDLLSRLIRAIGLDADQIRKASLETMRDLERTCLTCHGKRRCRSHLDRNKAAQYRNFCPNAEILAHLTKASGLGQPNATT